MPSKGLAWILAAVVASTSSSAPMSPIPIAMVRIRAINPVIAVPNPRIIIRRRDIDHAAAVDRTGIKWPGAAAQHVARWAVRVIARGTADRPAGDGSDSAARERPPGPVVAPCQARPDERAEHPAN